MHLCKYTNSTDGKNICTVATFLSFTDTAKAEYNAENDHYNNSSSSSTSNDHHVVILTTTTLTCSYVHAQLILIQLNCIHTLGFLNTPYIHTRYMLYTNKILWYI